MPLLKPVTLMAAAILLTSVPAVMAMAVPLPAPGSVSIKYSAAVTFCNAAGGDAYSGSKFTRKSLTATMDHLPSLLRVLMRIRCMPLVKPVVLALKAVLMILTPGVMAIGVA